MSSAKDVVQVHETQIPEWEHVAIERNRETEGIHSKTPASVRTVFATKLDCILPPHRKYIGLSRKAFLWTLFAIVLLLILIIGLAAGLSQRSRYFRTRMER